MGDLILFLFTVLIGLLFAIVFILAIVGAIHSITVQRRIISAINNLGKEVSDEKVKSFIKIIERSKLQNHPQSYNSLRAVFTLVNNSDEVSYDIKQELMNTLLTKGVNLGNARIQKSEKEREQERRETGEKGEENVSHNLRYLGQTDYKVLYDIRIPSPVGSQQIDHMVIGPNGVFHLETKNHSGRGKIIIDKNGNWIKETGDSQISIESPIAQVDRHDIVLRDYLNKKFPGVEIPVHPVIVLATSKYILEGQENSEVPVVKADQLTPFIRRVNSNITLDEKTINEIYEEIKKEQKESA